MKLQELNELFGFGKKQPKHEDIVKYDPNAPVDELVDILNMWRGESMMEDDPEKREAIERQLDPLVAIVAKKTARAPRRKWSDPERDAYRARLQ